MSNSVEIKKLRPWHEELMDFMIAQPRAGLKEASDYFQVSQAWLSTVKNSDAFREVWAKRRGDRNSAVDQSIVQRVEGVAEVALETLARRLEREGETMGITTLREVSETALKSLGFGVREPGRPSNGTHNAGMTINNNMIVVDREVLANARAARAKLQAQETPPLVGSPHPELEGREDNPGDNASRPVLQVEYEHVEVLDTIPPKTRAVQALQHKEFVAAFDLNTTIMGAMGVEDEEDYD